MAYQYNKGNYERIRSDLRGTNWDDVILKGTVEEAVGNFYSTLFETRDRHVPQRLFKLFKYPSWYNSALIKILKEKFKYYRRFKVYGNISDRLSYQLLRDRANDNERLCYQAYMTKIESSIGTNPKLFWSYVKSKRMNSNFPSSMSYGDNRSDSGGGICELFANYFGTTFLDASSASHSCSSTGRVSNCDLSTIEIDVGVVHKHLKSLDLTKSAGPDALPAVFIVKCAEELALPVSLLFQRSIYEGIMPSLWKSAFITPIHKKGAKDKIENYRPISKLCLLAKVLERIVYNQLYSSVVSSLSPHQHGFLKGRSTVSNLVLFTDYITEHMDNGFQVDAIYTDYSKAFDRIDHDILLKKLFDLGIRGDLFRWFSSYVLNRTQAVVLSGFISSWTIIPSGVPQGSLLGPLLFVLFINDIGECFKHSKFLMFADDMKIYKSVESSNDARLLQADISRLVSYCIINKLDLNISKCLVITFTRKNLSIIFDYSIADQPLSRTHVTRDLGIFLDCKLTFECHVDHIAKKASKALGFIIRNASSFNKMKTLKILYCAYVRSHLDYGSQIWNPNYAVHSDRLERIQRKFTRYLGYKFKVPYLSYNERCARFHLLPLVTRRNISDLRFLVKIAQSKIECPELLSKLSLNVPPRHSRLRNLLHAPYARTVYRTNSYIIRSVKAFNLIVKIKHPSIDLFASSLASITTILSKHYNIVSDVL